MGAGWVPIGRRSAPQPGPFSTPIPTESVLGKLLGWLAHYNNLHPHHAPSYRLQREFIARSTQEIVSGL